MSDLLGFLAGLAVDLLRGRAALVAENALLRQQLIVAERKLVGRVRWEPLWQTGRYAVRKRQPSTREIARFELNPGMRRYGCA